MKSQVIKRFNVNLTKKENDALEDLTEEYANRNWKANTSDIIRDAIFYYSKMITSPLFVSIGCFVPQVTPPSYETMCTRVWYLVYVSWSQVYCP